MGSCSRILVVILGVACGCAPPTLANHLNTLNSTSGNLVDGECVDSYDAAVDYFPYKLEQQFATGYSIEYFHSYKVITGPKLGTIVAYQCGTPKPNATTLGTNASVFVAIPLTSVGLFSTSQIPFLELIGERTAITSVYGTTSTPGEVTISSPCLREMVMDNTTYNYQYNATTFGPDLSYVPNSTQAIFCTAGWQCPAEGDGPPGVAMLPVADSSETSVLATAEWLEFFAAFFNREAMANKHIAETETRYNATRAIVATVMATPPTTAKPKVLWAYYYYGWYGGSCPGNYYCQVVADAGGQWLQLPKGAATSWGFAALTDDAFFAAAAEADVWLYADDFVSTRSGIAYVNVTKLEGLKCYENNRVYDFTLNNAYGTQAVDWLESRFAEPDVFLEDLTTILTPGAHPNHARVWWRNVLTQTTRTPRSCANTSAPLELWHDQDNGMVTTVLSTSATSSLSTASTTPTSSSSSLSSSSLSGLVLCVMLSLGVVNLE